MFIHKQKSLVKYNQSLEMPNQSAAKWVHMTLTNFINTLQASKKKNHRIQIGYIITRN